jgi:hypothetical protein
MSKPSKLPLYDFLRNESYLLRLCNKREWKRVGKCGTILIEILQAGGSVDEELISRCKKQLLTTDQWGNTALHVVCYLKPHASVLQKILEAASLAALLLVSKVNDRGATPLLIACTTSITSSSLASRNFIKTLLRHDADSTVAVHDDDADTPFLRLIRSYEIIRKFPKSKDSFLPLEDVVADESKVSQIPVEEEAEGPQTFPAFWESVEDLIRAAWAHAFPEQPFISILHGAAFLAGVIPTKLTDLILRVYKDQLLVRSSNLDLPLHLAIIGNRPSRQPVICKQQSYWISRLLDMDPSAVQNVVSTTSRSVFGQAIASGLLWQLPTSSSSNERAAPPGPLKMLFQHCPDAIGERDSQTGLYPFQLAATTQYCEKCPLEEEDALSLNTIYNLLRLCPESIHG